MTSSSRGWWLRLRSGVSIMRSGVSRLRSAAWRASPFFCWPRVPHFLLLSTDPSATHSFALKRFYPRRCKSSLVGQSTGLSVPRSGVRFRQKSQNRAYRIRATQARGAQHHGGNLIFFPECRKSLFSQQVIQGIVCLSADSWAQTLLKLAFSYGWVNLEPRKSISLRRSTQKSAKNQTPGPTLNVRSASSAANHGPINVWSASSANVPANVRSASSAASLAATPGTGVANAITTGTAGNEVAATADWLMFAFIIFTTLARGSV